jgi:hypothetical protein
MIGAGGSGALERREGRAVVSGDGT